MTMTLLIALVIGIACGLLIGRRLAERSIKEDAIYGGNQAKLFHWLACVAFTGGVPAGLTDIILGRNVLAGVLLALCFIGVSFAALLIFAALEQAPRAQAKAAEAERGWTAEKAKTSGL
jgi:ABC-type Fe3+ transport system permease subunit